MLGYSTYEARRLSEPIGPMRKRDLPAALGAPHCGFVQCISRTPTGSLARVVESIWHYESGAASGRERVLPHVRGQLIFNLTEDRLASFPHPNAAPIWTSGAIVSGPRTRAQIVDARQQRRCMGVLFRTAGMGAVLGIPAHELTCGPIELHMLWGQDAKGLREELGQLPSADARLDRLHQELHARLRPEHIVDEPTLASIRQLERGARVGIVRAQLGLSSARFVQLIRHSVGLNPKALVRVARFRRAVTWIEPNSNWSDVAAACGYFDQAHFIHDFREFAGVRPTDYTPRSWQEKGHVPILSTT